MTNVEETQLPGVGTRYEFTTHDGNRIGVIEHRGGRHDLVVYAQDDPDACQTSVRLSEDDGRTLADLLGAPQVSETEDEKRLSVAGLTFDWIEIDAAWPCAGQTVRSADLHTQTGVIVVAVARDDETHPTPGPEFQLQAGDTLVLVGQPDGLERAFRLLQSADERVCSE